MNEPNAPKAVASSDGLGVQINNAIKEVGGVACLLLPPGRTFAEAPGSAFPPVLDVCCGSRMFWFDRKNPSALFCDKREEKHVLCDGRDLEISPDIKCDFTALPFPDNTFFLVVFDPPHMNSLGANSWLAKKYGRLLGDWRDELREGFSECMRVLKPNGTLVFKWNTTDIPLDEVLSLAPLPPLFGHTTGRQAKTVWATFLKPNSDYTTSSAYIKKP